MCASAGVSVNAFRSVRIAAHFFAVAFFLTWAQAASAQQVQVNKAFTPASVGLGATTVVTVTLQNNSTTSAATISGFQDDIASMAGFGILLSSPAPTTTCAGGAPSVVGSAVVMNNGTIPIAPNTSTPGSCTITFSVRANKIGNGFNTIKASDVATSNGAPSSDVTQTLTVQSANIAVTSGPTQTVLTGSTATVTYTLTNPTPTPITNATFPITSNATAAYTLSATGGTCGGTAAPIPSTGTTGTTTFSGVTIPANGSCTVTFQVTTTTVETVNFALAANTIADNQAATNSAGVSAQAKFVNGQPNVTKSFNPTSAQPGGTSVVTIKIQNVLTDQSLTALSDSDVLPPGLTVDPAFTQTQTGCGGATLGGGGTGTQTISNATILPGATCTVTFRVIVSLAQAPGNIVNTVLKGNLTATTSVTGSSITQAAADAPATLLITGAGGGVTAAKAANPTSAGINTPVLITLTFGSQGGGVFSGGSFTDPLPQSPVVMQQFVDATHTTSVSAGCGGATNITAVNGATSVSGTGLAIPANGTCVVTFYVFFPNVTGVSRIDQNVLTGGATFTGSVGPVTSGAPSVNITELATITVTNYVASASGLTNQPLTVSATVNVPAGVSDTNAILTVPLTTGKVALAATPNFTFTGCPAGVNASSVVIAANRESFTVALGAITQSCTIGYDVIDEAGVAGTFTPLNPTYSGALTGNTAVASTGINNVTFTAPQPIGVSKSFTPNQIQAGGTSTAQVNLVVPRAGTLAVTEAVGVSFTDNLPANLVFSPTPNVAFTGCQQTGQPAPGFTISGNSISFTNISLITVVTTQTTCTASFDVTSTVVGAPLNQIPAGAVTSTAGAGASNTQTAKASLTVAAGLGVQKTFVAPSFPIGSTDYIRLLVTNTATPSNLSGGSLVDNMPAFLVLASTTEGPIQTGDPPLCGGTISGTVGSSSYTLNGLAVGGYIGGVAGQCVVYVLVKASPTAVPGAVTNTIASGGLNIGGFGNQNPASGTVTLTAAPAVAVAKSFAPTTIAPNGTSVLTVTISNTSANAAALTGLAVTDALPSGVTIAATPNASTTCGGTASATAGGSTVGLSGGSLAPAASCTITASVTASNPGTYTNTIPVGTTTTDQGASNTVPASANLLVAPQAGITKSFAPTSVTTGGSSILTITIANNAAGSVALSGVSLSDTLPSGLVIANTPNATTSCGAGVVGAVAGASVISLTNGSVAANATCTIGVTVTASSATTFNNVIPAGALTDTQGVSNDTPATATLTATSPVAIAKAFSPTSIASGATSTLTITIPNTAAGAVALSGMSLTDTLPANVTIASTPNASTTCGGTVSATAGGSSVTLTSGSLAANATCTITVSVTATTAGTYTNTIPASALTDTQNVTNTTPATAALTVTAPVAITKAFSPTSISSNGTSTLTITIPNTGSGAVALSGMSLTDTLPANVTIASTPNASTTCGGTVSATAGGSSVTLSSGSLAANAMCTITVSVTATTTGTYTNTIPANALTDTQNVTNTTPATAALTVTAPVAISKAFSPTSISSNGTSTLTITVPNTAAGAVALSGMSLTDTLPANVTIASTPNASTTCGGTVSATAGGSSVALSNGSLAATASCTITVSVTATTAGTYTNTIPASALTDTQNVTNTTPATAALTVTAPVAITKAFSPTSISSTATSTLTITIPNTAAGAVALSGMSLTDTLPANVTIASAPNASTTCGGSVSATAGGSTVALSGASLAANATCTITVFVTATATGTYTNTIPTNALTDTQNVTNTTPATAALTVTAPLGITKAFSPTAIATGGTSTLTITIPNTDAGAVALSGMALTDTLPNGITVASTPNASTTCGGGTVTANGGDTSVALSNGSLPANATCTIVVSVTGTATGTFTNTIPANALTDTQNVSNTAPATADLTIKAPSSISKSFSPATFTTGGTSTLTISIPNTSVGAVALTNMALTDNLPGGVSVASAPNASTTCGGTVAAAQGATSVSLSGGSLAANATCTIVASVTATTTGSYVNTIPAGALTDTQGVTNTAIATATVSVTRPVENPAAVPLSRWMLMVLAAALIAMGYRKRRAH